jgi:dTDP-glucose pyrophosphorylase
MQTRGGLAKAVILARGLGTRMRREDVATPVTAEQSAVATAGLKAMMPIGSRPFLDYLLSALADAGFRDLCLVVGPEQADIEHYYATEHRPTRIRIHFAIQAKPRGTADAVLAAEKFVGQDEFAVMNSDNYYPPEALRSLQDLGQPGTVLFEEDSLTRESNIPRERIRAFAYGLVDDEGWLTDLVEKPDDAMTEKLRKEGLVSMNLWRFSPDIFDACRAVSPSPRGELELPAAVREAVRGGAKLKVVRCRAGVLDLSQRADIPQVVERLQHMRVSL